MKLKYAVYPGPVKSRNDGDIHFIGAAQLMALYKVHPQECLVIHPLPLNPSPEDVLENRRREHLATDYKLILLFPRFDGNYTIPL